jgi:hypothetical protein
MPNIDYLKIFHDGWKITWKNRFLWWFGLFLLLPGILNPNYFSTSDQKARENWQSIAEKLRIQQFISEHSAFIAFILGILGLLFLAFLIISFVSRGAIIRSTQKILKNEAVNFKTGFKYGKKYFWKVLAVYVFPGFLLAICFAILFMPVMILFVAKSYIIASILAIIAVIILIPLIIICKYIQAYATLYTVLANLRPWLAVENAYALFKKNILASIIMSLLFIPLGIFSLFLLIFIILIALFAFSLIGLVLFFAFKETGIVITIFSGLVAIICSAILLFSIFRTFSEVAWVLFFHVIATPKVKEVV